MINIRLDKHFLCALRTETHEVFDLNFQSSEQEKDHRKIDNEYHADTQTDAIKIFN